MSTEYWEAMKQVFPLANLLKKDVFYDLGCGCGRVCIWAARRCKFAKGIDNHGRLLKEAKKNVKKSSLKNVKIRWGEIETCRFPEADVLYCVVELKLDDDFKRWNRRKRKKSLRIVTLGPPPIPILPVATKGKFYLTKFPYKLAKPKEKEDWHYAVLGKRKAFWKDIEAKLEYLDKDVLRRLKKRYEKYFKRVR